jgi:hypothetical protein
MKYYINKTSPTDSKLKIIDNLNAYIAKNIDKSLEITINNKRTSKQNNSLHLYFSLVAKEFNNLGLDFSKIFKDEFNMIVTPDVVKENLWKTIQKAMYGSKRTRDLNVHEIDKIYDVLHNKLINYGIYVRFPNKDELMELQG